MTPRSRKIPEPDLKLLWCKSGGVCAVCRRGLASPAGAGVIGAMAHIVAYGSDGPRANGAVPDDELNVYGNLVLLCPSHHAEVDKAPDVWPASRLRSVKRATEAWVTRRLRAPRAAGTKCLFVISGPSGVGKDVVIGRLLHSLPRITIPAVNLKRYTTRRRRPDEKHNSPFKYFSDEKFDAWAKLEKIGCVHESLDNHYGCDPRFSPASRPGTAIFYSMRVYGALSMIREAAENVGVGVRNILLAADARTIRSRILMRSASSDEKADRIDQALEDLDYLEDHREFTESFFDLALDNSDNRPLADVMVELQRFVQSTMEQVHEIGSYWDSRTNESNATSD